MAVGKYGKKAPIFIFSSRYLYNIIAVIFPLDEALFPNG
jgi:hypothetical protein